MKYYLVLSLLLVSFLRAHAQSYQFQSDSSLKLEKLNSQFQKIQNRVPRQVLELLSDRVVIRTIDRQKGGSIDALCGDSEGLEFGKSQSVLGYFRYEKGTQPVIFIHRDLIDPKPNSKCSSQQVEKLLTRTLVHELSHHYDNQNFSLRQGSDLCQVNDYFPNYNCQRTKTVSDDFRFVHLTGFDARLQSTEADPAQGTSKVGFHRVNVFTGRSERSYEHLNVQENFAVNMELFTHDPSFKCRKPALYQYLSEHFQFHPYPEFNCQQKMHVLTIESKAVEINPAKIHSVHFVKMLPGKEIKSWWGHASYRLVICAPQRQEVSDECLKDTQHHLFVDFSAQLNASDEGLLGFLTGKYSNGISFTTNQKFHSENILKALRDTNEYRLKLTGNQIQNFARVLVEKYWTQYGRYFFTANNCATLAMQTLLSAVDLRHDEANVRKAVQQIMNTNYFVTPSTVVRTLHQLGLIDSSHSKSSIEIKSPMTLANELVSSSALFDQTKLKDLLQKNSSERQAIYRIYFQSHKGDVETLKMLTRLFILVEQIVTAEHAQKNQVFWGKLVGSSENFKSNQADNKLLSALPSSSVWEGYGVPQNIQEGLKSVEEQNKVSKDSFYKFIVDNMGPEQKKTAHQLKQTESDIFTNTKFIIRNGKF